MMPQDPFENDSPDPNDSHPLQPRGDSHEFPWQRVLCRKLPRDFIRRMAGRDLPDHLVMQLDRALPSSQTSDEDDQPIDLTPIEFSILCHLASRPYHAYTKAQIVTAVRRWTGQKLQQDEIDQHVWTLRHKLGMFHDYVQTVPYVGYRFKE